MRTNVYSQELITGIDAEEGTIVIEPVQQKADNGIVYSAVRLFLHSSERLHYAPDDDDRSVLCHHSSSNRFQTGTQR